MSNKADANVEGIGTIQRDILVCECHSLEHQIAIWYDKDDNQLYAEVHLTTSRNFWERLKAGIKYAFGYRSRFGDWDEFMFKNEDLPKLKEHINKVQNKKGK